MKNVKIDDKLHKQTKVKCAEHGVGITCVVNGLLDKWLKGEIKYDIQYKK